MNIREFIGLLLIIAGIILILPSNVSMGLGLFLIISGILYRIYDLFKNGGAIEIENCGSCIFRRGCYCHLGNGKVLKSDFLSVVDRNCPLRKEGFKIIRLSDKIKRGNNV